MVLEMTRKARLAAKQGRIEADRFQAEQAKRLTWRTGAAQAASRQWFARRLRLAPIPCIFLKCPARPCE